MQITGRDYIEVLFVCILQLDSDCIINCANYGGGGACAMCSESLFRMSSDKSLFNSVCALVYVGII